MPIVNVPGEYSIEDMIASEKLIRDNYYVALVTDSAKPQMDYSFDGQSVSRDQWRAMLRQRIAECNENIAMLDPTEITTVAQ